MKLPQDIGNIEAWSEAIATAVALVTLAAGLWRWLYRRRAGQDFPDPHLELSREKHYDSDIESFRLTIRNRAAISVELTKIVVQKPDGAIWVRPDGREGGLPMPGVPSCRYSVAVAPTEAGQVTFEVKFPNIGLTEKLLIIEITLVFYGQKFGNRKMMIEREFWRS